MSAKDLPKVTEKSHEEIEDNLQAIQSFDSNQMIDLASQKPQGHGRMPHSCDKASVALLSEGHQGV